MSETWRRRILIVAGLWNLFGGASALADPGGHFAQLYTTALDLDDPLTRFFYRAVWINVVAWGLGYLLAAFRPAARLPILAAGGAGKAAYGAACLALVAAGVGNTMLLAAGVLDFLFAGCFAYLVWPRRA